MKDPTPMPLPKPARSPSTSTNHSLPAPPSRLPPSSSVACYGSRRRSPSNEILFGEAGWFDVYVSYGIHHCEKRAVTSKTQIWAWLCQCCSRRYLGSLEERSWPVVIALARVLPGRGLLQGAPSLLTPGQQRQRGQMVGRVPVITAPSKSAIATTDKKYWSSKKLVKSSFWAVPSRFEIKPGQ